MSEILQIFYQSPPSHQQIHSHLQQCNWSFESDFQSPVDEFAGSPFTNLSSSSVDELSKVTAVIEKNQSMKKRKLESVDCDSVLTGRPKARRSIHNGNSKAKMDLKPETDYVHVRARRGQATDSHSIAERARREKIKKKMQYLQDLVPGCNKITNKAAILDEIITYVQCLQRDVKFLAMKLAASTTSVDFIMDNSLPQEQQQKIQLSRW